VADLRPLIFGGLRSAGAFFGGGETSAKEHCTPANVIIGLPKNYFHEMSILDEDFEKNRGISFFQIFELGGAYTFFRKRQTSAGFFRNLFPPVNIHFLT